jgi:hypothetical protein
LVTLPWAFFCAFPSLNMFRVFACFAVLVQS